MWSRLWKTWVHLATALCIHALQGVDHFLIALPLWMIFHGFLLTGCCIRGLVKPVGKSVQKPWTDRCKRHG
jgi:hypothetical protein